MDIIINIILVASPCIMLMQFWVLSSEHRVVFQQFLQFNTIEIQYPYMTFAFHIQLIILYSRADNFNPTISVKCIMQHIAVYYCGEFIPKYAGPLFNILVC